MTIIRNWPVEFTTPGKMARNMTIGSQEGFLCSWPIPPAAFLEQNDLILLSMESQGTQKY
ncbi:MAG: hypothetical protein OXC82_07555 [Rhodobacteraceae bacterium]|nr:hypothetical protein [Paracoccaceae bacterium]MCY4250273.1 hypothetical protein [Paracoccaceae bacterium]